MPLMARIILERASEIGVGYRDGPIRSLMQTLPDAQLHLTRSGILPVKLRILTSVDLFAGCGGLSLGLEQAGFRTLAFSEVNRDAAATFRKNLGHDQLVDIGDIANLTETRVTQLKREWKRELGSADVDLVSGGPPCQGYSGIGHRRSYAIEREQIPSNHLFREMVRVVKDIRPKAFIFENVRGLLSGRWTKDKPKGSIWKEVRETFRSIDGYEIGWRVVHAKWYGVPQNRPRVLLVGIRSDLGVPIGVDVDSPTNNPRGLIPDPTHPKAPDLIDVLSDLDEPTYIGGGRSVQYVHEPRSEFQKQMRITRAGRPMSLSREISEHEFSKHKQHVVERFREILEKGRVVDDKKKTKKFAQRRLPSRWDHQGPTITATSLPDDFVHYKRPRALTVREWARLQMFPDWFEFEGPRTTGGLRRAGVPTEGVWAREVPKYTQIGNAVPVGMAYAVGRHLAKLLRDV